MRVKIIAWAFVILFIGLVALYVQEFKIFTNTLEVKILVWGALFTGLALGGGLCYLWRKRFSPAENHLPEIMSCLVFPALFMPLFASLINRSGGKIQTTAFLFVKEGPFVAEPYRLFKGPPRQPSGYFLIVESKEKTYRFRYKTQPYFPITNPGDTILLPIRTGILGVRVLELQ